MVWISSKIIGNMEVFGLMIFLNHKYGIFNFAFNIAQILFLHVFHYENVEPIFEIMIKKKY